VLQDLVQGADTVPDSTTTESESVSDVQLLRAGGDERTIFKLTLQVRKRAVATGSKSGTSTSTSTSTFSVSLARFDSHVCCHISCDPFVVQPRKLPKCCGDLWHVQASSMCDGIFTLHFVSSPAASFLQITKVELLLNNEGSVDYPLAIGSIDNFLLELAVHPATLQVWYPAGTLCTSGWRHASLLAVTMHSAGLSCHIAKLSSR
jgi:hypothetical protein